jgi:hypothetical protein
VCVFYALVVVALCVSPSSFFFSSRIDGQIQLAISRSCADACCCSKFGALSQSSIKLHTRILALREADDNDVVAV